ATTEVREIRQSNVEINLPTST
ncbi:MAG: hypothetical protein JWQ11_4866, partial [Rhizobacter sp.]|nr:hypothetical protein [Rhizobacter sp.]